MTRILSVVNQKGGVGKTTTAVNMATALAAIGKQVLVIDLDPQGNASTGLGIDQSKRHCTSYDVLIGEASLGQAAVKTAIPRLSVAPATIDLSGAEMELINEAGREYILRELLAQVADDYDYILIDCPPSLSLLTLNGLCAAHGVIIPMQCEYYALEGLSDLVNSIKKVHANLNRELSIIGLLRVMFDPRVTLQQQVSAQLEAHFGNKVFKAIVPRNVRLAEAPSHGIPGVVFDRSAKGAQAYLAFAKEMIERVKTL